MRTYTAYNIATMMKIVAAINCLPESYALRNESVKSIEVDDDDKLIVIHFPAMTMRRVTIMNNGFIGWKIEGQDGVWMDSTAMKGE